MSTVISAKVPKKLKEKAKRYGLKIGEVVRKALEEEVKKVEEERLSKELKELSSSLKGRVTREDVVKAIRSSRDER
ncbi:MAG: type II toxin-antitoxin system CcdA family antitoxin [Nitrososphaerales archaeon]